MNKLSLYEFDIKISIRKSQWIKIKIQKRANFPNEFNNSSCHHGDDFYEQKLQFKLPFSKVCSLSLQSYADFCENKKVHVELQSH